MSRAVSSTSWSEAARRGFGSARRPGPLVSEQSHASERARFSAILSRRALLCGGGAGLAFLLSGCGFRPLHAPLESTAGEVPADVQAELAAVRVGPIGERYGQMMRRDLQRRLEGNAPGTPARYLLNVGIGLSAEVLGYRRDGTISRVRYTARGEWTLTTQSVPPRIIGQSALPFRTIDSFNVPDLQFFSADTSREAMERRLAEVLADEIAREVTFALRQHLAAGRPSAPAPAAAAAAPAG